MLRCVSQELKKIFYLPYVLIPVLGIVCLCLASTGAVDENGKSIAIFSLILQNGQTGNVGAIEKSALFLWKSGVGDWLVVFLPLLLTFGYIAQITGERQSGQVQFALMRSGNLRYCLAKVISGALFGGIVFVIGYALFGIILAAVFPSFSSFPYEIQSIYPELFVGNSLFLFVIKQFAGVFLYGVFGSVFGIGVSVLSRDKYMLLCIPFLLNYIYRQILQKLLVDNMENGDGITEWISACYPDFIIQISPNRFWLFTVILMLAGYVGLTVLFYWEVKRGHYGG